MLGQVGVMIPFPLLSCQLRTGNLGYSLHRLTTIGQRKIGKMLPGLMSLFWKVRSVFGANNMKAWIHPASYQQFSLVVVVYQCGRHFHILGPSSTS